ncbi:MAG: rhodanese-like domain-containing protein [Pseudomonadota bacterium]
MKKVEVRNLYSVQVKRIVALIILIICTSVLHAGEVLNIDNKTLKELIQNNVPVIDVRTTTEWKETGVVKGSHLLMFYDEEGKYDLDKWLSDVAEIADKNQPMILICHSGSRSKQLAKYLTKVEGYEKVYNVKRGIQSWIKKNNHVIQF